MDIIRDLIKQVNRLQLQIDQLIKPEVADGKIVTSAGALTAGRVPYVDANQRLADSANLVWDNANGRFGVGTASPGYTLEVYKNTTAVYVMNIRQANSTGYGLRISTAATSAGMPILQLINGSGSVMRVDGSGNVGIGPTAPASRLDIGDGALTISEMTAPAAPAANGAVIYAEDDGSGKTRLMVKFASGAAQQIAIQP